MPSVRRLGTYVVAVAIGLLIAAPAISAAPAARTGTSYYTTEGVDVGADWTSVAEMQVPPGKYHITASVLLENFHYGPEPGSADDISGPYINRIDCSLFAHGITTGYALTSLAAGGYASVALDGVVDGSSATAATGVWIYLDCRTNDGSAVPPYAGANLVADAVTSIVDLRQQ